MIELKNGQIPFQLLLKSEDLISFRALSKSGEPRIYAYIENDKIIGTVMTYTKNGNCGIHEVSVLGEHRGKGIAKNLFLRISRTQK